VRLDDLPALWLDGDLRVAIADTRRARRLGLTGLREIDPGDALLLPRCRSVHTFGMRFAIDVVFLGADGETVRVAPVVPPRRIVTCRRARATLETAAGCAERFVATGALLDAQAIQ
jgi:uncharacterized membrane protein (UPF0127 family)